MALSGTASTNTYEGRYYRVTWNASQDVANNKSTISWALDSVGGSSSWYAERTLIVSVAGNTVVNKTNRVERYAGRIASGKVTVNHNSTTGAASFTISIQAAVYTSSVNCTTSSTFTLDTIPRKSTMTISGSGNIGSPVTFTIKPATRGFKHKITAKVGNTDLGTIVEVGASTTSASWTPPITDAARVPNGTQVYYGFYLQTYNGSTLIGTSSYHVYLNIPTNDGDGNPIMPVISSISHSDANGYFETYGKYVKNNSKISVTVNVDDQYAYGATIKSCDASVYGQKYSALSFTTNVVSDVGEGVIRANLTDSRNRSTGYTEVTIDTYDYSDPKITGIRAIRCGENGEPDPNGGEYLRVYFSASVTSLDGQNKAYYTLSYTNRTTSDTALIPLQNYTDQYDITDGFYTFKADTATSYDISIMPRDNFKAGISASTVGGSVSKVFSIRRGGRGMAFGKVAELDDTLDFTWYTYLRKGLGVDGESVFNAKTTFNSNVYAKGGYIYDHSGQPISNGMVQYTGSGDGVAIDPDTTLCELILTDTGTTDLGGGMWYIRTMFYDPDTVKQSTSNRAQYAYRYNDAAPSYYRYRIDGTWSSWMRQDMLIYADVASSWNVRKWASGDAEIWCTVSTTVGTSGQAHSTVAFPFNIISNRHASVTFGVTGTSTAYLQYVKSSASNIDMYGKGTASTACWFDVRVIGKWK